MKVFKGIYASLIRDFVFWLLVFQIQHILFIVFNWNGVKQSEAGFWEVLSLFYHGLKLDASMASYFIGLPLLFSILQSIINIQLFNWLRKILFAILLLLSFVISIGEIGVYPEWEAKLSYKVLFYLQHPEEIAQTAETSQFVVLLLTVLILSVSLFLLYHKIFYKRIRIERPSWWFAVLHLVLSPGFLLIGLRGGFGIPINQASAFYSNKAILNDAAVNSSWNLMHSILQNQRNLDKNPFEYTSKSKAEEIVKQIHERKGQISSLFETHHPNIVLVLLEGWSADVMEYVSGDDKYAPTLNRIAKEGYCFTNFYSNGLRSQQAISNIFAAYPAPPVVELTHNPTKYPGVECILNDLNQLGYHTSFYFGGELIYGNIKSFLLNKGIDKIVEEVDFGHSYSRGKLGVHDDALFQKHLEEIEDLPQPFFTTLFTMSSHSPYDFPGERKFKDGVVQEDYLNGVYYTDKYLGQYISEIKKRNFFDNTVFVFVADHSHPSHLQREYGSPEAYKIPFIVWGPALKNELRGRQNNTTESQVNIASTLLESLGSNASKYVWSQNMTDSSKINFAYYQFKDGLGWISDETSFSWENRYKRYKFYGDKNIHQDSMILIGRSYLQKLYQDYLDF